MYCEKCGHKLHNKVKFCPKCGCKVVEKNSFSKWLILLENKKIMIGAIAIISLVIIVGMTSLGKSNPETVVKEYYQAISKSDIDKIIELTHEDIINFEVGYYGSMEIVKEEMKDPISYIAMALNDELGSNWVRNMKLKTTFETTNRATVEINFMDTMDTIDLQKEGNDWKIYMP